MLYYYIVSNLTALAAEPYATVSSINLMRTEHYFSRPRVTAATILAIVSILWATFAYAEHQVDFDHSHHQQHQCELYAAAANGLSPCVIVLPEVPQQAVRYQPFNSRLQVFIAPKQKARSPPELVVS